MNGRGAELGDPNPAPQQGPGVQVQGGVVEGEPGARGVADRQVANTRGQGQGALQTLKSDQAVAQDADLVGDEAPAGVGIGGQQQGSQQQQRHADEDDCQANQ